VKAFVEERATDPKPIQLRKAQAEARAANP